MTKSAKCPPGEVLNEKVDAHTHFARLADSYGDDYKDMHHKKYPANRFRLNIVKDILSSIEPKKIIDIGCGTGDPLIEVSEMNLDIVGFDYSDQMVKKARENVSAAGLSKNRIFQDDMEKPRWIEENSFDCMLALGSVYYARNFASTMANLVALLKPGGHFIFSLRNKLFSMFSMNHYTTNFILQELTPEHLPKEANAALVDFLDKKFGETNSLANIENVDTSGVHSTMHNPLTIEQEVLRPISLTCSAIYYYHYHALPPIFEKLMPQRFRQLSENMESDRDWRGMFMASGFVVHAVKS
jgi:2-polyprenyl-3-methyl-5-hydroxy-6-metoxy-1,4-benzoquinol methylase